MCVVLKLEAFLGDGVCDIERFNVPVRCCVT